MYLSHYLSCTSPHLFQWLRTNGRIDTDSNIDIIIELKFWRRSSVQVHSLFFLDRFFLHIIEKDRISLTYLPYSESTYKIQ